MFFYSMFRYLSSLFLLIAALYCADAGQYVFEVLELNGSDLKIQTPNPTPAGFAVDYSIRANPTDAVVQVKCTSLQLGQVY